MGDILALAGLVCYDKYFVNTFVTIYIDF